MLSYLPYRNFKAPLPRVASTCRSESTYTSFVRKTRRHFLHKHLSKHPVINYPGIVGNRTFGRKASPIAHVTSRQPRTAWRLRMTELQQEFAEVSLWTDLLLTVLVSWAIVEDETTAADLFVSQQNVCSRAEAKTVCRRCRGVVFVPQKIVVIYCHPIFSFFTPNLFFSLDPQVRTN